MKKLLLMTALMAVFPFSSALAVKVASLYQAQIPVMTQAADERAQAARLGLIQVLVKVSGDPQIEKNPEIRAALAKADYYVQEFSYSASTSQYLLQMRFEKEDITHLLKQAGIIYWGENRPLMLVWLAMTDKDNTVMIIGNESPGDLLDKVKQTGKKYGLPLIFPMMDVAEVNQVSTSDVTSMSLPILSAVGKRYGADAILIGDIEAKSGGFESKWHLSLHDQQWDWELAEKSIDNLIDSSLYQASQTLAKQYVEKAPDAPQLWLKLEVINITERNDLVELLQYLKQVNMVQKVQLAQITSDVVDLSVLIRGSVSSFKQNAELGQRLVYKAYDETTHTLTYQWAH